MGTHSGENLEIHFVFIGASLIYVKCPNEDNNSITENIEQDLAGCGLIGALKKPSLFIFSN